MSGIKKVKKEDDLKQTPSKAKKDDTNKYPEVFNAYQELTGAFPNKEWDFDTLVQEYEKEKEKISKIANTKAEESAIKEKKEETLIKSYNTQTHVLVKILSTGIVKPMSKIQYNLVKNGGNVKLHTPALPELKK